MRQYSVTETAATGRTWRQSLDRKPRFYQRGCVSQLSHLVSFASRYDLRVRSGKSACKSYQATPRRRR